MKKSRLLLAAATCLLAGCASNPWPKYEDAMRCHLDSKGAECDKLYESAIALDPKMQGVHASYGVHLMQEGRTAEAGKQFEAERANYPTYAEKSLAAVVVAKVDPVAAAQSTPKPDTASAAQGRSTSTGKGR